VRAEEGTIPVQPTPLAQPVAKAKDDEELRLVTERRKQLQREKEATEREAIRRETLKRQAAEKERQAAEDAKRQAAARQRAAVSRAAALPPAQAPAAVPRQGPAAAPRQGPSAASPAAVGAFRGLVIGHLAGYKRYPESARARGAQGRPTVSFSLDASGHVASVALSHSSGQPDIDAEAVSMVRRASPFPAPPPGANRSFTAAIGFQLH
jgi:colicin import membrane protein